MSQKLLTLALIALFMNWQMLNYVQAAAGDLDNTFGGSGKVTTNFLFSEEAFAVAIQADGKIVAAGVAGGLAPSTFALARYNSNGTLDSSFGTGGRVTTGFDSGSFAADVVIAPNSKIIVAGVASGDNTLGDFAVARYHTDGSLDSSFGLGGKVTTDFFGDNDTALTVVLQSDGRIVVGGYVINPFPFQIDFALARYNADGTLDSSFGSGGKLTTDFSGRNDFMFDLTLQANGKVVATGTVLSRDGEEAGVALTRYNSDGSLDPSFGSGGKVTTFIGANASAIGIQPSGKIVVAGAGPGSGGGDFALLRYNPDGTLDPSFGVGGLVTTDISGFGDGARRLAIYPNGKIVVGGNSFRPFENRDFSLALYNADGSLDTGFGSGGKVVTDFSGDNDTDVLHDIALQPDGKIVAAGGASITNGDFALARYNGDAVNFDICLQDESNGNLLQINTTTGEYQFSNCASLTLGGIGTLTKRGNTTTLQHNAADRRVLASVDTSTKRATASIQLLSQGRMFSITDRNITNNTCACR